MEVESVRVQAVPQYSSQMQSKNTATAEAASPAMVAPKETTKIPTRTAEKHNDVVDKVNSAVARLDKANEQDKKEEEKNNKYSEKEIETMIKDANIKLLPTQVQFAYKVHAVTKCVMIKVIDASTREVIHEIPDEKSQDALAKMWKLAGLIVDEKR